jgi:hypothetical protein
VGAGDGAAGDLLAGDEGDGEHGFMVRLLAHGIK